MKKRIRFLYIKWFVRICPHTCLLCRYRKEEYKTCYEDISNIDIKYVRDLRKKIKKEYKKVKKESKQC